MTRDEEKHLHTLPEERTMTAREALARAMLAASPFEETTADAFTDALDWADAMIVELGPLGFGVYQSIPVPGAK